MGEFPGLSLKYRQRTFKKVEMWNVQSFVTCLEPFGNALCSFWAYVIVTEIQCLNHQGLLQSNQSVSGPNQIQTIYATKSGAAAGKYIALTTVVNLGLLLVI